MSLSPPLLDPPSLLLVPLLLWLREGEGDSLRLLPPLPLSLSLPDFSRDRERDLRLRSRDRDRDRDLLSDFFLLSLSALDLSTRTHKAS